MIVYDCIFTCMSSARSAGWSAGSAGPGSARSASAGEADRAGWSSRSIWRGLRSRQVLSATRLGTTGRRNGSADSGSELRKLRAAACTPRRHTARGSDCGPRLGRRRSAVSERSLGRRRDGVTVCFQSSPQVTR